MKYEDVVASAFEPSPPGVVPAPTQDASPARRLRDAIEPLAMHSVWSRTVNEALYNEGLDFFQSYVWGRASLLGEPDPGVVVSSFAVFSPALIGPVYESAIATLDRSTLVRTRDTATITSLAEVLDGISVAPVTAALRLALETADATARPLFAGLTSQPWPSDPIGQLWRACELLREHRGDSHNLVWVLRNLNPVAMNIVTELWLGMPIGTYSASRGWSAEQLEHAAEQLRLEGWLDGDQLSEWGKDGRDAIEDLTDGLQGSIVAELGDQLDPIIEQLSEWSQLCIDAGAFPPNVFKRAAG